MTTRLRRIDNPPGLAAIACRIGDHDLLRRQLLDGLANRPALARLTTRSDQDPAIALLDAWACAASVLTFYQERIAHESYLRTAGERLSLRHLARLVGYELDPGLAAEAALVLTADPLVAGDAPVRVEPGLRAQSSASGGQPPQIFETTEPLELRAAWNELRPAPTAPPATTRTLDLEVPLAALTIGEGRGPLVLITAADPTNNPRDYRILLRYHAVEVEPGVTRVTWDDAVPPPPALLAFTLRRSGPYSVLGNNRVRLESVVDVPWIVVTGRPPGNDDPASTRAELYPRTSQNNFQDHVELSFDSVGRRTPNEFTEFPITVHYDPTPLPVRPAPPADDRVWLRGAQQNLRPGDTLLFVADDDPDNWRVAAVRALEPDRERNLSAAVLGLRLPRWNPPLPAAHTVHVLRQRASLFGHNAPDPNLVVTPDGSTAIAGNPRSWTAYDAPDPALDLDNAYPAAVAGDPVVLVRGDLVSRLTITRAETVSRAGFGLSTRITRVTPDAWNTFTSQRFGRRDTEVLLAPERLLLADPPDTRDVAGTTVTLAGAHALPPGRRLLVTGTTDTGAAASELVRCASSQIQGERTAVALSPPLSRIYRRTAVTVHANVARATHGERIDETLGDGDPAVPFQSFPLRSTPLTHVFSDEAAGRVSTLELRVDGQPWREVPTLFAAGPQDRVFTVRADEDGVRVHFGDGRHGARLPAGRGNVRASYRRGTGLAGQVPARAITSLVARPAGVGRVDNPLPARGAADPEGLASARRRAPGSVRTLGRVVSRADYVDFARAYPGVAKAHAAALVSGLLRFVRLTIAGPGGAPIVAADPVWIGLRAALRAAGDDQVVVRLRPAALVPFALGGTVIRDRSVLESTLRADLDAALRARFGFDARDFLQPVYSSEVVSAIQAVPGVLGVDLTTLRRADGDDVAFRDRLTASAALDGPGELLVLDPDSLAQLTVTA